MSLVLTRPFFEVRRKAEADSVWSSFKPEKKKKKGHTGGLVG